MTDWNIVTSAEQPINRDGAVANAALSEGEPVGLNGSGQLVAADAVTGTAIAAVGVMMAPVDDKSSYPTDADFEPFVKILESERVGIDENKVAYATYGVEVENGDADSGWTPGDQVYLAEGGGYTTTAPSDAGDIQQVLGYVLPDGESFMLDVSHNWSTV